MQDTTFQEYLSASPCIESDHSSIASLAAKLSLNANSDTERVLKFYYFVRDEIRYNPYTALVTQEALCASHTLEAGEAWCVPKAVLMAALCRAQGIPARLGFADVVNHLSTERLRQSMQTDVFYFHGYCSVYLNQKWVKCTPAFNLSLCKKFNLKPLEFDGMIDSLYHEFDNAGNRHMEYVNERGEFLDVPMEEMKVVFEKHYPSMQQLQHERVDSNALSADAWDADVASETQN